MARFDNPRGRRDSKRGPPRRDSRRSFNDDSRGRRDSSRGFSRDNRVEMTKVICSSCGEECEVPFKPRKDTPVYCRECFFKKKGITPREPRREEPEEGSEESEDMDESEDSEESEESEEEYISLEEL